MIDWSQTTGTKCRKFYNYKILINHGSNRKINVWEIVVEELAFPLMVGHIKINDIDIFIDNLDDFVYYGIK